MEKNIISTAAQNSAVQSQEKKPKSILDYVRDMAPEIAKALPSVITPERFTRMVTTALSNNRQLLKCSPKSFIGAMMTAAQLGMEPNTPLGQAYLIPYRNHGELECQFQIGYKGLLDLAYRSGEVTIVQAHTVYANDEFEYSFGLSPTLHHVPAKTDRGEPVFYYAVFQTKSGGYGFEVMSVEDVRQHAIKYSKAYSSSPSPWKTNFDEMAKKTVLKRCLKYAPLKSDFARAVAQDATIKTEIAEDMYEVPAEDYTIDDETGEVTEDTPDEQTEA